MRSRDDLFEWHVLRHLDAAYNLAWWFLQNQQDAEDVVQESLVKAFRSFEKMGGADGKPWLMQIVRNGCLRHLERRKRVKIVPFDDCVDAEASYRTGADPQSDAVRFVDRELVNSALKSLPELYREVLVLREFEDMNYAEIAIAISAPVGTVMSRLSRARAMLAKTLRRETEAPL